MNSPYKLALEAIERGDLRAVDALVAEHVMGLHEFKATAGTSVASLGWGKSGAGFGELNQLKSYSTSIAAAWEVVEKMRQLGFGYCIECCETETEPTVWFVKKSDNDKGPFHCVQEMLHRASATGPFPRAASLAALKTLLPSEPSQPDQIE